MKGIALIVISLTLLCLLEKSSSTLQFELQIDKPRCYIEELYQGSVMLVKWKVAGLVEPDEQKAKMFLSTIQYAVSSVATSQIMKRDVMKETKGKFSYHSEEQGLYKICITFHGGWTVPYPVLISLKISSDNMDEPDIKDAIKTSDVNPMHQKAKQIIEKGKKIVKIQSRETTEEDLMAVSQIANSKYYYNMAVFQILVIFILGIYQVFRFKKFLVNNNVI